MAGRWLGHALSALRQGISVGVEFGPRALEALVSLAETVEQSVYEDGSLVVGPDGLGFVLSNPPLRVGAFSGVRLRLDGTEVAPDRVRLRPGPGTPWRATDSISAVAPFELRPGVPTEVAVHGAVSRGGRPVHVRLEFDSIAIPPLVWFEFEAIPRRVRGS